MINTIGSLKCIESDLRTPLNCTELSQALEVCQGKPHQMHSSKHFFRKCKQFLTLQKVSCVDV